MRPDGRSTIEERWPSAVRRALRKIWNWGEGAFNRVGSQGLRPELPDEDLEKVRVLMVACTEERGGATSARTRAAELGYAYLRLDRRGRGRFLKLLTESFDLDGTSLDEALDTYLASPDGASYAALREAGQPPRLQILRMLNSLPDGFRFLVDLRADLLALLDEEPSLAVLDYDLQELFDAWFDVGLLTLDRISWDSPASLLEKLVAYEAVHEIRSWSDLKNRLEADRRCYAFFHPKIPGEPLIFVEVALTEGIPGSVQDLLDESAPVLDPDSADTAVFYSISNTQKGLRGVSFGSFLLKEVMADLSTRFPRLRTYVTLSPIPGFRKWLTEKVVEHEDVLFGSDERRELLSLAAEHGLDDGVSGLLALPGWHQDDRIRAALERPLIRLGSFYLTRTRNRRGLPLDPVGRFHLVNGARVERLAFLGDTSKQGLEQSFGMMVNYRYVPERIEENHERLLGEDQVASSAAVERLAEEAEKNLTRQLAR
ncbi:MAG: malonyl-CoA decarboxylase family protein [Trueperaceae bacterium]